MNTRKTSKGFTLVELLIVIAIIGMLASLIMPNLGSVMGKGDQVKAAECGSQHIECVDFRSENRHEVSA